MLNRKGQDGFGLIIFLLIAGLFMIIWALSGIYVVHYNEYAFERQFGKLSPELKDTGINYKGLIGTIIVVNNQVRNHEITVEASSKDLQKVSIVLNINMQLKKDKAFDFIKNYATEESYTQYLNNKMQENIKIDVLKYNVLDFINNRSEVSRDIKADVQSIPELDYFDIKDISMVNVSYSLELESVLEQKGQVLLERDVITRKKENILLIQDNINAIIDMDAYFKYSIAEKWDGKSQLTMIETTK